jgi:hypothetical protein
VAFVLLITHYAKDATVQFCSLLLFVMARSPRSSFAHFFFIAAHPVFLLRHDEDATVFSKTALLRKQPRSRAYHVTRPPP